MLDPHFWSMTRVAGLLLVLGAAVNLAGVLMFAFRDGQHGGAPPTPAYYVWERGLVLTAVMLTALGFVLLEPRLQTGSAGVLARIGANGYLLGAVLLMVGEALNMSLGYDKSYPLIVIYVVVAYLAEAAIGGALLQSGLLAAWMSWATLAWNLAFLIGLLMFSPRDMYFPVFHHIAPLAIGIALLLTATEA